ncbi:T9SS type A sorting domain-containing protein [Draconibacterium sp.]|nr:T9SS type A sorting domain-containing protein [Draconibacterium sp.]
MIQFMRKYILFLISFALLFQTQAQQVKGGWQDYLSYSNATKIAVSSDKVYCATEGGLLFYDLQDNSVGKFSGLNELSDFGIKTIAYNDESDVLIIAYKNSNIDLVYETGIINLPDIKRKQLTGDKSINNISFIDGEAYLSCGFGIVVLNLQKREVRDTYFIGDGGSSLSVNDIEGDNDYLYAATDNGIRKADKNGANLLDYQSWIRIEDIPHSYDKFSHIEIHANNLIANYTTDKFDQDELYILSNGNWNNYLPQINYAYDIQSNGNYMAVCSRSEVFVVDNNHSVIGILNAYQFGNERVESIKPRSAGISGDGSIWIADFENSLVKFAADKFESIYPSGPLDNEMFSLTTSGSELWITPGGRSDAWNNTWQAPRFQRFGGGEWTYFNKSSHSELDGFFDIVKITVDPTDPNHVYVGSWGGGLLEFRNDEFIQRYTNNNSPLQTALPQQPNEPYVRIGGLDFDSEGNLWITNSEVARNLLKLSPQGEWESFSLPGVENKRSIGEVVVTQDDDKWILIPRGYDAYVVDKTGERKKRLFVTSYFNNGTEEKFTRMNDVYSITEDLEGSVWIGTSVGVAVYNYPSRIWDSDNFYGTQPGLDLNDGIYHPLLKTETVTAIAIDGANRKWLGTKNSGVYLVSENGEKEIQHFTQENSPLLSNTITAIAVNQKSGEVFFGTDQGLIAYQGDATGGSNTYKNVYVYPNPVRETYDGPVTVTGLIENTDVKITDISGNLVFKTTSLGGQATWDGTNLNGNRVKTGVYLVFCNDESGEETHITKLLFIN